MDIIHKRMDILITYEEKNSFPPPSDGEAVPPLSIELAGISYCAGDYRIARNNSRIGVIEYVVSGRGTLTVDGECCTPEGGDVYIIPRGSNHSYASSADAPWVKKWFNLRGNLIGMLLDVYLPDHPVLVKHCPVEPIFDEILQAVKTSPADAERIAPPLFLKLILAIAAARQKSDLTPHLSRPSRIVRQLVEDNLFRPAVSLSGFCRAAGRSPAQLLRIFRRECGVTPGQYQIARKMEYARDMLRNSTRPVKAIAFELGFADEYYFSTLFKRKCGVSPLTFRRKNVNR